MALLKNITLDNGVTVKYHRITSIHHITNCATIIEIGSYTSQKKREEEKQAIENNTEMNVYIAPDKINIPFDSTMDIHNAYEYLKTTEKYDGAKNA